MSSQNAAFDPLPWERTLGATPRGRQSEFRVWAPHAERVSVASAGQRYPLEPVGHGVHSALAPLAAGADYRYVLTAAADGREQELPDPASRHQPQGLRGPSRVLDTASFEWTDAGFRPPSLQELVCYELHVGTFTAQGTFAAAAEQLAGLRELGVNAVELMPVADFPGERGWGYDGVYLSAAHRAYGGPAALARFVDAAHAEGIAVLLDVVYNHVGASGAGALEAFGPYFTDRYETFWGRAINYDDAQCDPVREWVLQSAVGWVRDFHLDGLRLDAVHAINDSSPTHIVAAIVERVHAANPAALVIAESGLNDPRVIRPPQLGGWGADAQWADDFHHALFVLLSGERDGYYVDFGTVAALAKAFERPFVHDGNYSPYRARRFGAPAGDRPPEQFVVFTQNHDQVGNRAFGDRPAAAVRRLAAFCVLLSPFTPMLFMGEEYGEPAPFQFFCDHIDADIAQATRDGRRREFAAFASFAEQIPDPQDPATFANSKLTRVADEELAALYRELLALRKTLHGPALAIAFDEPARWLRVTREGGELVCNFATRELVLECDASEIVLASAEAQLDGGTLRLAPLAGALLR